MANRGLSGLPAPALPSHPCRGGRGSLKGRGAFQAPSLPFKANLSCSWHQLQQKWSKRPPPNSSPKHICAKKALQTRILSTCTSSSAEPEALEAFGPIKQGVWDTPSQVSISERQPLANGSGFRVPYLHKGLGNWACPSVPIARLKAGLSRSGSEA